MDFEADPNIKFKSLIKKNHYFFSISKSMKFPFRMQWKYCQKIIFEADPNNKLKNLIEGSLEVKLPTIWRDEKQSREEAERRERLEERRVEEKE